MARAEPMSASLGTIARLSSPTPYKNRHLTDNRPSNPCATDIHCARAVLQPEPEHHEQRLSSPCLRYRLRTSNSTVGWIRPGMKR